MLPKQDKIFFNIIIAQLVFLVIICLMKYIHARAHIHTYTHIHIHTHTHTRTHARTYAHTQGILCKQN